MTNALNVRPAHIHIRVEILKLIPCMTLGIGMLACLLGLLLTAEARAQQPSVDFIGPEKITTTPGETVTLQLQNNTPNVIGIELKAVDIAVEGGTPLSTKVSVTPDKFNIQPAGGTMVKVCFPSDMPASSPSAVYIVAFENAAKTFARRKIEIRRNVAQGLSTEPLPTLPAEWAAYCRSGLWPPPFISSAKGPIVLEGYLPLRPEATAGKMPAGQALALVVNEDGDSGVVSYTGTTKPLDGGVQGIQLSFNGPNEPGIYKGNFNRQTEADKEGTKVSVTYTHHWLYPLITLALGVGLAFALKQRYVGVSRPLLIAEEKRSRIEEEFAKAQENFRRLHQGKSYLSYDIALAFRDRSSTVGREIIEVKGKSFSTVDAADLKKVNDDLNEMAKVVTEWSNFPERLARLETTLASVSVTDETPRPPADPPVTNPAVIEKARQLLIGSELSLADFTRINQEVLDTTERLNKWTLLNDSAAERWASIHKTATGVELKEISAEKNRELRKVEHDLQEEWLELWTRDDYINDDKFKEFSELGDFIRILATHFMKHADKGSALNLMSWPTPGGSVNLVEVQAAPQPAARKHVNWRPIFDWVVIVVTVAVVVYTGLNELYFGKAFGTLQDYLKAFFWGFGAQTVLTGLVEALNLLWNSRSSATAG